MGVVGGGASTANGVSPASSTAFSPAAGPAGVGGADPCVGIERVFDYMKCNLLAQFCRKPGYRVLDMGCGPGVDVGKWDALSVREWVGVDMDAEAVAAAGEVYNSLGSRGFHPQLVAADATRVPIWSSLGPVATGGSGYDIVSVQRALEYGFESEAQARMMLWNIAVHLKPGACVVGTTVDERQVRVQLGSDSRTIANEVFTLKLAAPLFDRNADLPAGTAYSLAIGSRPAETQYVVPLTLLKQLAGEVGLSLVVKENFRKAYPGYKKSGKYNHMLTSPSASKDEWEALSLFMVFALHKKEGKHVLDHPVKADYPPVDVGSCVVALP